MSKIYQAFKENEATIRRVVAKYRSQKEDIEDLMQETFIKCFAADIKQRILDPKAFILRVAKNVAISEAKRKRHTTTSSVEDFGGLEVYEDTQSVSVEDQINDHRKLAIFTSILAELPLEQQRALIMRKVHCLKFKQIATRLDVSVSTVEKRVASALLRCNDQLRAHGYDLSEFGQKLTNTSEKELETLAAYSKYRETSKKL